MITIITKYQNRFIIKVFDNCEAFPYFSCMKMFLYIFFVKPKQFWYLTLHNKISKKLKYSCSFTICFINCYSLALYLSFLFFIWLHLKLYVIYKQITLEIRRKCWKFSIDCSVLKYIYSVVCMTTYHWYLGDFPKLGWDFVLNEL